MERRVILIRTTVDREGAYWIVEAVPSPTYNWSSINIDVALSFGPVVKKEARKGIC